MASSAPHETIRCGEKCCDFRGFGDPVALTARRSPDRVALDERVLMSKSKQSAAKKKSASRKSSKASAASGESDGPDGLSFEAALTQLETTVGRLEEGEMPLEEALELFETGVKLSRQCTATLEAAEKRIEILVADRAEANGLGIEAFESEEDFDDDELADDDV